MLYLYLLIAVQIVVESLPISSSGHVMLVERMMNAYGTWPAWISKTVFQYSAVSDLLVENSMRVAHGATLIILGLFFAYPLYVTLTCRRLMRHALLHTLPYVIVADCTTALWYVALHEHRIIQISLSVGFAITMCLLYGTRFIHRRAHCYTRGFTSAVLLGCAQGIALLPGISRLATVYAAACVMGFRPTRAFQLAWAIHAPLMAAVTILGIYRMYQQQLFTMNVDTTAFILIISACIIGYAALYATWYMVQNQTFWKFAWYMPLPLLLSLLIAQ